MVKKQKAVEILERLMDEAEPLPAKAKVSDGQFLKWRRDVEVAIEYIFPDKPNYISEFRAIRFSTTVYSSATLPGANERAFLAGLETAGSMLVSMRDEVAHYWKEDDGPTLIETVPSQIKSDNSESPPSISSKNVFVVHGRNGSARKSIFEFLRAIGLKPLEWTQAVAATGKGSPYVGEILDAAFLKGQAVVVLMTPDDDAVLKTEFQTGHDEEYEKQLTGQARPNVLFEAGMAMGRGPDRTILVKIGNLRPFSDVDGRHVVRMDNSTERRQELANRLKTAGCDVDLTGTDWHKAGSFDLATLGITSTPKPSTLKQTDQSEFKKEKTFEDISGAEKEVLDSAKESQIHIHRTIDYGTFVDGFFKPEDAAYQEIYNEALELLIAKSYLRLDSQDTYRLTRRGHDALNALRTAVKEKEITKVNQNQTGGDSSVNIQGRDISVSIPEANKSNSP